MRALRRAWAGVVLGALALAGCAATQPAPGPSVSAPAAAEATWPHQVSDLKPDPGALFGVLPNGMRFQIQRNTQPAGVAALRLRIAAGSLQEADDQEGIAHFLEHMAFNGSKNVPEGEMIKLLERQGLAFGPDTNAYTSFGETVYQLDLPEADNARLDTAFLLLRELADRLTLAQDAIDREKGVILSEERARDTPESRIYEDRLKFWLKDQRLTQRFPIGTVEDISAASATRMRDFYESFYRPERALLVVTGDIDPAAIEARIKTAFTDWKGSRADPGDPVLGAVAGRSASAELRVEPAGPTRASVTWISPPDLRQDAEASRIEELRRGVALAVVNRRLERIARGKAAPFIAASVSHDQIEKSATLAGLSVSAEPGRWAEALAAAEQEVRRAVEHGLQPGELARELSEYRAGYESRAAGAATRDSRSLADEAVSAAHNRWVFTDPATELALFEKAAADFRVDAANALLKASLAGEGPLVFLSAPQAPPGGAAAVLAAYQASRAVAVAPPPPEREAVFDYVFGEPGKVVARVSEPAVGAERMRFANGVKLTVKPTAFEKDRVYVAVRVAGGYRALVGAGPAAPWAFTFALTEAGVGKLDREDLDRATTGRVVGLDIDLGEDAFSFSGATRPADLDLQMGVLTAYVSDPGWRSEGLARLQSFAPTQFQQLSSSPGRVLSRDAPALLRGGDARWRFPSLKDAQALTMDDLKAAIGPALARAPIEVIVVGDVTLAAAEAAVARTLGALPARAAATPGKTANVRFQPPPAPVTLSHAGRPDQAVSYAAFAGRDFSNPRAARAQRFAAELLQLRLTEEVRERLGASYSPTASDVASRVFPGFGYVSASAEIPPAQTAAIFDLIETIGAELAAGKFDEDLIARARAPLIDQAITAEKTNGYWLGALQRLHDDPGAAAATASRVSDYRTLTRAEVEAAAKALFAPGAARLRVSVTPRAP